MNDIQVPSVTNNTTNIIINNLTYLNAPGTTAGNLVEELNRSGAANLIKNADQGSNLIEEIKIVGKNTKETYNKTGINLINNNIKLDHSSDKANINISNNNNKYLNAEILEKIQKEIKNIENINDIANNTSTSSATHATNFTNTSLITNTNNNTNNINASKNQETQQHQLKTIIKKEVAHTNNKNIERYVKKKVSPYSAISHNQSYNTEKSSLTANSPLMNNTANPKEPVNNNSNLNITATQNKYILSKLSSAANKKSGPKTAFFNTSMSFDQNNDTKNTTFDNELVKKYENNNNNRNKSDDKNSASAMNLKNAGNNNSKRLSTTSEIANAIKNNTNIGSAGANNKNNNNSNNENYLIKKSINKKFDTIREEDEEVKTHKKPFSYLNYYTKYAPEAKNHKINQNLISAYNADSNYPKNSITTNNNNNNIVNNTTNPDAGNTSILKKITKRFNNESSFLEQYVTNNKKIISSSYASSPNKKTSVSPVFKNNGANSSRVQNANGNNNSSIGKDIYTITENAYSSSRTKSRVNAGANNTSMNKNNISADTASNFNNTGKSAFYDNNNNNSSIVNTYSSNNKTDNLDFHRKIRHKNISVPNAAKFITGGNKQDASKFKKINNTNLINLDKFINPNNNNIGTDTALSHYKNKSPLKKPPVSTSMAPIARKSVFESSKTKSPNLNMTGHSIILNNSARKNYNINNNNRKVLGNNGAKSANNKLSFNLNLTKNNLNNTLVTEDNNVTNPNVDVLHTRSSIVNNTSSVKKGNGNDVIANQNFINNNDKNSINLDNNANSFYQGSVTSSKNKFNLDGNFLYLKIILC